MSVGKFDPVLLTSKNAQTSEGPKLESEKSQISHGKEKSFVSWSKHQFSHLVIDEAEDFLDHDARGAATLDGLPRFARFSVRIHQLQSKCAFLHFPQTIRS